MMTAPVEDVISIQQFLYREARLLDQGKYREWLDMLSDGIRYTMPVRELLDPNDTSVKKTTFAIFDDDKASLEMRVYRYETGFAHAEAPSSVTHRMIANIEILEARSSNEFVVHSNFVITQERMRSMSASFYGTRRDVLQQSNGSWLITARHVELAQTIIPSTISIFF